MISYNKDAECSVLGGLLIDNESYDRIGKLNADDFYVGAHQHIFKAIQGMLEAGQSVDVITLSEQLKGVVGIEYLDSLESNTPSVANLSHYSDIIRRESKRRRIMALASELAAGAQGDIEELLDTAQGTLERISAGAVDNAPVSAADDMTSYINQLEASAEGRGESVLSTGYVDLDNALSGGLRGGDTIIVAGRPGMGKSLFSQCLMLNVSKSDPVLFLSQEMKRKALHDRSVSNLGSIPMNHVLQPKLMTEDEWGRMPDAVRKIQERKIFIDDQPSLRLSDVRQKAKAVKRKHGLSLLIIDYLQLMIGEGANRNLEIEALSKGIKALAMELDIPVIILSQLNRGLESRESKRPVLSDLRDSGSIEQDASIVMFLYRDAIYHQHSQDANIMEVIIPKNRQGSLGTIGLAFDGQHQRVSNLEKGVTFGHSHGKPKPKYSGIRD